MFETRISYLKFDEETSIQYRCIKRKLQYKKKNTAQREKYSTERNLQYKEETTVYSKQLPVDAYDGPTLFYLGQGLLSYRSCSYVDYVLLESSYLCHSERSVHSSIGFAPTFWFEFLDPPGDMSDKAHPPPPAPVSLVWTPRADDSCTMTSSSGWLTPISLNSWWFTSISSWKHNPNVYTLMALWVSLCDRHVQICKTYSVLLGSLKWVSSAISKYNISIHQISVPSPYLFIKSANTILSIFKYMFKLALLKISIQLSLMKKWVYDVFCSFWGSEWVIGV